MNKILTVIFIATFVINNVNGQNAYSPVPEEGIVNFVTSSTEIEPSKAKGSPYLNEEFVHGEVIVNEKVEEVGKMRYNAYRNEVEILDNLSKDSYYSLLKRAYIKVEIDGKLYCIYTYVDNDKSIKTSYFTELNKGPLKLLFKPEALLKQARSPSTSYEKYSPPTYVWNSSYYILDNRNKDSENHAVKVRLTKNNILDFTGSKKNEMKLYVKEKKLNLRKEQDVIAFLNYFNSL
ncbi:hypothetical protein [Maribacter sp. 1_2014MBL_MicDiv]|uniref:hypothetical protein n=1 Tax=Maribacter sp. 1_2014MBL_MicDiv TaxID=1644130 RepID=UPI0008F52111|nr:hypothetical protein [Maribacter sp. 1_2014MBL_MicDiv]APA63657.1 hypothetical protein YQ22_04630 [Maribacter sp. 1_2014MBL_MicDiv]